MLYTRKGDAGTTKTFGCDQRISKSSNIAEALGSLDEINSFLGICKVLSGRYDFKMPSGEEFAIVVHTVQENLFIIQAEVAGSEMSITEEKVTQVEKFVDGIEQELPPIRSFFISGGSELGAYFDTARTIARRAERRVVAVSDEGVRAIGNYTKAYLNRLSSLLYALARYSNHLSGVKEDSPNYK